MTFRQQLLSFSNCCLLFSARGRHREQQIVIDVTQLVGPSSLFMTPWLSCRILTASRIHLVVLSDSRVIWRPLAEDSKQVFEEDSSCCKNVTENLVERTLMKQCVWWCQLLRLYCVTWSCILRSGLRTCNRSLPTAQCSSMVAELRCWPSPRRSLYTTSLSTVELHCVRKKGATVFSTITVASLGGFL